jgi:hypothetical protein
MTCTTHVFGVRLGPHDWQRSFVGTDTGTFTEQDMWGRHVDGQHVVCHTRMVCRHCGAIGAPVECICDASKADRCAFRLDGMSPAPGKT